MQYSSMCLIRKSHRLTGTFYKRHSWLHEVIWNNMKRGSIGSRVLEKFRRNAKRHTKTDISSFNLCVVPWEDPMLSAAVVLLLLQETGKIGGQWNWTQTKAYSVTFAVANKQTKTNFDSFTNWSRESKSQIYRIYIYIYSIYLYRISKSISISIYPSYFTKVRKKK